MGTLIEGCACKNCKKEEDNEDNEYNEDNNNNNNKSDTESNNDEIDNSLYAYSRKEIPKNIVDVKFRTDFLVKENFGNPFDIYLELEELGEGAYGVVKKVCLKDNPDTIRAMKIISKENIMEGQSQKLIDEIKILKKLEHPNIMKIYEYFNDKKNIYIISELCDQGDLLGKLTKLGKMSELVVKFLMGQILNALSYLHDNRVFHGDIKLENVMLYKTSRKKGRRFTKLNTDLNSSVKLQEDIESLYTGKKDKNLRSSLIFVEDMTNYEVKIIDFGCSKFLQKKKNNKLSGIVGTSIYCSPEVIDNEYDERSDEWSCGVLMYILLCGEVPFPGETEEEIFANVKKGCIDFSKRAFKKVSPNCIDLIKKLLTLNKKNRITASEALKHKFFTESFNPAMVLKENKDFHLLKRLLSLQKLPSKFHEMVVAYCCFNFINKEEEKQLRELFRFLDRDNKNKIALNDFQAGFREAHIMVSKYELKNIMNFLDTDGSGLIEYQEFLRATCDKKLLFKDENLKAVFGIIDKDKKGYATSEDIQKFVLGTKNSVNRNTIKGCIAQIGMKKNSILSFEQFCDIIRNNSILQNEKGGKELEDEDEGFFAVEPSDKSKSTKNIIEQVENDKLIYNMTEGDQIVEIPNHFGKGNRYLHRINTTKA